MSVSGCVGGGINCPNGELNLGYEVFFVTGFGPPGDIATGTITASPLAVPVPAALVLMLPATLVLCAARRV